MLLVLLAALAQEGAGDLKISRPPGWLRSDDATRKTVTLAPPDLPPGALCSVTLTPGQPYALKNTDYHDATWSGITGSATVTGGAKAETAGAFLRSWGELRRPDGATIWITLYTAVAEGRAQTLMYVASTPDLFRQHAGAVDAMVQAVALPGQPPAPAVAAFSEESVAVPAPDGWTKQPGDKGAVVYLPPNLRAGQSCSFVLYPSEASTLEAAAYHQACIQAATTGLKALKVTKTADWGDVFKGSDLEFDAPQGGRGKASVYTARWGGRGQMGIYTCNDEAVYAWSAGWIPQVLIKAYVPNARLRAGAPFVPIVEVFFKAELELGVTVDLRAGTTPQPTKKFLVLFKNGLALRVDAMSSGLLDGTYVAKGLASLDAEALLKQTTPDRRRGTWKEQDGKLVLNWSTGTAVETYAREGVRLVGPKTWSKFSLADGLKIDGAFVHKNDFGLAPWTLRLTKEGRFEADGINWTMGGRVSNPTFPDKGAGTYEIRSGTIILRYDNGYRTSIALLLGGDDPANPASLILNGTAFERR